LIEGLDRLPSSVLVSTIAGFYVSMEFAQRVYELESTCNVRYNSEKRETSELIIFNGVWVHILRNSVSGFEIPGYIIPKVHNTYLHIEVILVTLSELSVVQRAD